MSLRPPEGDPLPAMLVRFGYETADDGSVAAKAIVELDLEAYTRVDREHLFHLLPEVRGPGAETFSPRRTVRIELQLKSMLVPQIFGSAADPDAAGHRLVALAESGESVLAGTESWYARRVSGDVELLPGVPGELRQGFRTAWTADDDLFARPVDEQLSLSQPLLAVVEGILRERGWDYRLIPHRDALGWKVRSDAGAWECYAIFDEQPGLLLLYSVIETLVPVERRPEAAVLLTRLNHGLPVGNWELDFESGALRYKTSLDVGAGELPGALFERLLERNLNMVAVQLLPLIGFALGRLDLDAALAAAGEE